MLGAQEVVILLLIAVAFLGVPIVALILGFFAVRKGSRSKPRDD